VELLNWPLSDSRSLFFASIRKKIKIGYHQKCYFLNQKSVCQINDARRQVHWTILEVGEVSYLMHVLAPPATKSISSRRPPRLLSQLRDGKPSSVISRRAVRATSINRVGGSESACHTLDGWHIALKSAITASS
jgi:hypothetical protein